MKFSCLAVMPSRLLDQLRELVGFDAIVSCLAVMASLLLVLPARADNFDAYAAPNVWSPPYELRAHYGAAPYTVSYSVVGNTSVIAEVTYFAANGRTVTQQFNGSIKFTTGNAYGVPKMRFKGMPLGSAVRVSVGP